MYDARSRSRFRLLVTALTGAATVGSLTAAGVITGALARAAGDNGSSGDAADSTAAETPRDGTRVVRWQDRPRRTVVRRHRVVRVVPAVPEDAVPAPGDPLGGGTVTGVTPEAPAAPGGVPAGPPSGSGSSGGSGGSGGGAGGAGSPPAPQPPSQPVEPPPPPPPAPEPPVPSTGS